MLDACPHHHEDSLDEVNLRSPRSSNGKRFWRSLDEYAQTPEFEKLIHREFPHAASEWKDDPSRRNFLKLMAASLALGGLAGCTLQKTKEDIVPYVRPPEELIPGRPLYFATSMPWCGYGKGVIVESHEGRPTKIEGNPDHPASLGATDVWQQSSILDLYDPDRSQIVMNGNVSSTWGEFLKQFDETQKARGSAAGNSIRFLTGAITSPTIARLINQIPNAKWHTHEPVGRTNARRGAMFAFGQDVQTVFAFDKATVIVSLDSNFLIDDPGSVIYSRRFIDGRRIREGSAATMNRLYVAESTVSLTGAMADHRLPIRSSDIANLARELASAINGSTGSSKWITAVAKDLTANRGRCIVIAGETQPAEVHALVHAMNQSLGNVGNTITYIDPVEAPALSLDELTHDILAGNVDTLFILGTNPAFTADPLLNYGAGGTGDKADFQKNPLSKVKTIIHHGLYFDETAFFSHWRIPASHYLECWGDVRAFDGTASIIQPLIMPIYESKSEIELLAGISGMHDRSAQQIIRETWQSQLPVPFESNWKAALEKGVIVNTSFKPKTVALSAGATSAPASATPSSGTEIVFRPDPSLWDGRYANNGWLQELPKPINLLTWDNAALMSLKTAQKLGVHENDSARATDTRVVELQIANNLIRIPVLITPGHAEDSITVYLGGGRGRAGRVGTGVGANVYALRSGYSGFATGAQVRPTNEAYKLATVESHHLMDGSLVKNDFQAVEERNLYKVLTLDELATKSTDTRKKTISLPIATEEVAKQESKDESMLPEWKFDHNKWGMLIDNNACIGCNACVVACQSENNIPVVGKEQVIASREMHWIRIDSYFDGDPDSNPGIYFQPIPCMHCETAPCTLVCPVEATTISAEGINEQTYNRCVGTRYCSNNCPYKVRRFNFLYYSNYTDPTIMLQKNPNVTVRSRGVMEKCTYCVQRINNARIDAKKEDRPINPTDFTVACAQACPTQAILFGNLNDDRWDITQVLAKEKDRPLHYTLLPDLNTSPRTTYLARLRNPNPELL